MKRKNRTRAIYVFLTAQEFEDFDKGWKLSSCATRSAYMRKLLFGKPITVRHRNESLDDLMTKLIPLRAELNSIRLNLDRVTEKLRVLQDRGQIDALLSEYEEGSRALDAKITEIKSVISHIDDKWLQ